MSNETLVIDGRPPEDIELVSLRNRLAAKDKILYSVFDRLTSWLVDKDTKDRDVTDDGFDAFEDVDDEIDDIRSDVDTAINV
jgi:hypothetical protein